MLAQAVSKYSLELSKGENQLLAGHMNKAFVVWAVAEFNSGDVNCSESLPCIYRGNHSSHSGYRVMQTSHIKERL